MNAENETTNAEEPPTMPNLPALEKAIRDFERKKRARDVTEEMKGALAEKLRCAARELQRAAQTVEAFDVEGARRVTPTRLSMMDLVGVTPESIRARAHRIFVGISLGNPFFADVDNLAGYLVWALEHGRGDVDVLIADSIHWINLHYRDECRTVEGAKTKAHGLGMSMKRKVETATECLPAEARARVRIVRWEEACQSAGAKYLPNLAALQKAFEDGCADITGSTERAGFWRRVVELVSSVAKNSGKRLSEPKLHGLSAYVIHEVALMVGGLDLGSGDVSTVLPYPEMADMQRLIVDLQSGSNGPFPQLSAALRFDRAHGLAAVSLQPVKACE